MYISPDEHCRRFDIYVKYVKDVKAGNNSI